MQAATPGGRRARSRAPRCSQNPAALEGRRQPGRTLHPKARPKPLVPACQRGGHLTTTAGTPRLISMPWMTQGQAENISSACQTPTTAAGSPPSWRNLPSGIPAQPVTAGGTQPALPLGCFPGRGPREDFAGRGGEEPAPPCCPPLRGEPAALGAALSNKIALCCALH